jgi:hypothetical protein
MSVYYETRDQPSVYGPILRILPNPRVNVFVAFISRGCSSVQKTNVSEPNDGSVFDGFAQFGEQCCVNHFISDPQHSS